ncbi:alpha-mannosidase, partial [Nostoc sp. UCD122]|nr:alpha-mannosidase [Nostoc sp. UCD122]
GGIHEFAYTVYPHADSWESAHTVQKGYELNIPLQVILNPTQHFQLNTSKSTPNTRDKASFLNLPAENLVLMAVKPSEDDQQQLILRFYESHGVTTELSLQSDLKLTLGIP